jgi:hypothetical protein
MMAMRGQSQPQWLCEGLVLVVSWLVENAWGREMRRVLELELG